MKLIGNNSSDLLSIYRLDHRLPSSKLRSNAVEKKEEEINAMKRERLEEADRLARSALTDEKEEHKERDRRKTLGNIYSGSAKPRCERCLVSPYLPSRVRRSERL
jgi:hypothetical protein